MPDAIPVPLARRSGCRRLLVVLGLLGLLGSLAVIAAGWWAWSHPGRVVDILLQQLPENIRPTVGDVQVQNGALVFEKLVLNDLTTGKPAISIDEMRWQPSLTRLPQRHLGSVSLTGTKIDVDAPLARRLSGWMNEGATSSSRSAGFTLDEVKLEQARVSIAASESWPAVEFTLDHHSQHLNLKDLTHPSVQAFDLTLRDVKIDGNTLPLAQTTGSLSDDGLLKIDVLRLKNGTLAPTLGLMKLLEPKPTPATTSSAPGLIKAIELGEMKLENFSLAGSTTAPTWWPRMSGKLSSEINGLSYSKSGRLHLGPQEVQLTDFVLLPPAGEGHIKAASAQLTISGLKDGLLHVLSGKLYKPEIAWTQALEDYLMLKPVTTLPTPTTVPKPVRTLQIDTFELVGAKFSTLRTHTLPYEGKATMDLQLNALSVDTQGASSAKPQTLTLREVSLAEHPTHREQALEPFARLNEGRFVIVPDEWNGHQHVREITLLKPAIHAHRDNVSWFDVKPATESSAASSTAFAFDQLHFDHLVITGGSIDYANDFPQRIEVRGLVDVSTSLGGHTLKLSSLRALLPQQAKLPIANVEEITAVVEFPAMLKTKRLQSLLIKGGEVEVGDALMSLVQSPSPNVEAKLTAPKPAPLAGWRINELSIADTAITLQRIAPGLPPLKFDLGYHAFDMPLAPSELAGNFETQRIELSQLAIKSPYESLRNVATLDTIFIDFTLDGIFKQRIAKVEVVSPTIFVGEDLFWYIDYYRKYAAGEVDSKTKAIALAANDKALALTAATAPSKSSGGWSVETLQVHAGKLVIAPKGHPLPGIPRPFPFSFTTRMNEGKLVADLDIPSDTYTWEQLKIELENMRGRVQFNLPIKSVDNNLTETFQVDRIRWKQLHMEDAHLSVTYDMNGIYGKFGGAAYEGYVNGEFNIYLDTNFSWDGWITGTGVRTTEITQKMCPAYFLLDGKVDTTVIAQGNQHEVYQCDVKFKNQSPGKFSIVALNDMLESLPPNLAGYEHDIKRIAVETLRDFDYDTVDGQCRFYGREGKGFLRMIGSTGSRNIDLNIYDHRWKVPKPKVTAQN
jgi:hypothetical protein